MSNNSEYIIPPIDGWMLDEELYFLYSQAKQMETIIELGSWKGKSTHALASGCKGELWCVDHWQGSIGDNSVDLAKQEDIFSIFLDNIKQFKNINILKMSTNEAVKQFEDKSIDMIFIDASHDYAEVKNDITNWYPKAKKLICGHDYQLAFPGVIQAVNEKIDGVEGGWGSIWFKKII